MAPQSHGVQPADQDGGEGGHEGQGGGLGKADRSDGGTRPRRHAAAGLRRRVLPLPQARAQSAGAGAGDRGCSLRAERRERQGELIRGMG